MPETRERGLLPVYDVGTWVRLTTDSSLPEWARGQNAYIVRAPVEHVHPDAKDSESPIRYRRQDPKVKFLVRVRESSQEIEVTRDKIAETATNVGDLAHTTTGSKWPAPEDMGPNLIEGEQVWDGEKYIDPFEPEDATEKAEERAQELGVNLADVTGTGKDGRVTVADVEKHHSERS